MSSISAVAEAKARYEDAVARSDFLKAAACVMTTSGSDEAVRKAQSFRLSDRTQRLIKAAVPGATLGEVGLSDYGPSLGSFMDSLRNVGAFDRLQRDALNLPLRPGRVVIHSSAVVASEVDEAVAKPIKALDLTSETFEPRKIVAMVVLSRELIDGLTEEGLRALGRELRSAVSLGSDAAFLTELGTSNSFDGSSTTSFATMLDDLEELTRNVQLGATSKPYLIMTSPNAKGLAKAATANGVTTMGIMGGELLGVPIVVSDGQGSGKITLVDASALVISSAPIELRTSEHASIEMNDAPSHNSSTPTAASLVSMWQTNNRCLLCERQFAVKVIRPSATATLTNVSRGAMGDSPAGF
jgi:hypothetical protein